MLVEAPAAEPSPLTNDAVDALFEEARQRQRRRQRRLAWLGGLVVLVGIAAYAVFAVGARSSDARSGGGSGAAAIVPKNRVVVLLVDVSGSMAATDIQPSRLGATRKAIRLFLGRLSPKVEVGLVDFSTTTAIRVPPTLNRTDVLASLAGLTPEAGTALGDGLAEAVDLSTGTLAGLGVQRQKGRFAPAAIVLVSDGAQNRGPTGPLVAAREARAVGVKVYGIALGTKGGEVALSAGITAQEIRVPPDPGSVRSIAALSHGDAFVTTDPAMLDAAFEQIAAAVNR